MRIASLLASGTEIVCGLGLDDRLVAISHECDYPLHVMDRPRVTFTTIGVDCPSSQIDDQVQESVRSGRSLYQIDRDRLVSAQPDLIVTQSHCDVCAVDYDDVVDVVRNAEGLRDVQIIDLNPNTLDGIFHDILRVGRAAGCSDRAQQYVADLRTRIDAVREKTMSWLPAQRPRVACIEWIEPLMLAANWMPELVDVAGGRCDLAQAGRPSGYSNWEDVRVYDPQVIVVAPCGFDLSRTLAESPILARHSGWQNLSAVRSGRVWAVDGNAFFNRSGPRIVDSLEILAHLIHPDHFAPPQTTPAPAWAAIA